MHSFQPRARSRLKPAAPRRESLRHQMNFSVGGLKRYFKHLPLLILAAPFYVGLILLVTRVHPEYVSDWLLPQSYLPLHLILFAGNFFLFTFLTLSKRWGIFIALSFEWLVFLKLQNVIIDFWAVGSALLIGVGGFWLRHFWKNRQASL